MIVISDLLWHHLLDAISRPRRQLERVAYVDGVLVGGDLEVATTIVVPHARLDRGSYRVSALAMSQAGRHLRTHSMIRLAQVHTHPGVDVQHSPVDDALAYSQHVGAVSIVVPRHGRNRPDIGLCGVHIRTSLGWERLSQDQVDRHLRLVPGLLDYRRA